MVTRERIERSSECPRVSHEVRDGIERVGVHPFAPMQPERSITGSCESCLAQTVKAAARDARVVAATQVLGQAELTQQLLPIDPSPLDRIGQRANHPNREHGLRRYA